MKTHDKFLYTKLQNCIRFTSKVRLQMVEMLKEIFKYWCFNVHLRKNSMTAQTSQIQQEHTTTISLTFHQRYQTLVTERQVIEIKFTGSGIYAH